jgi:hypothetical protein
LTKKLALVLLVTFVPKLQMQLLSCMWIMLVYLGVNMVFTPWEDKVLNMTENVSMGAIALSFGLVQLLFFPTVQNSELVKSLIFASLLVCNGFAVWLLAKGVFLTATSATGVVGKILRLIKEFIDEWQKESIVDNQGSVRLQLQKRRYRRYRLLLRSMSDGAKLISEARELTAHRRLALADKPPRPINAPSVNSMKIFAADGRAGGGPTAAGMVSFGDLADLVLSANAPPRSSSPGSGSDIPQLYSSMKAVQAARDEDLASQLNGSGVGGALLLGRLVTPVEPTRDAARMEGSLRAHLAVAEKSGVDLLWLVAEELIPELFRSIQHILALQSYIAIRPTRRGVVGRFLHFLFPPKGTTSSETLVEVLPQENNTAETLGNRLAASPSPDRTHTPVDVAPMDNGSAAVEIDDVNLMETFDEAWIPHVHAAERRLALAYYRLQRSVRILKGDLTTDEMRRGAVDDDTAAPTAVYEPPPEELTVSPSGNVVSASAVPLHPSGTRSTPTLGQRRQSQAEGEFEVPDAVPATQTVRLKPHTYARKKPRRLSEMNVLDA